MTDNKKAGSALHSKTIGRRNNQRVVRSGLQPGYYYQLFKDAPVGYLVLDEDGELVALNDTAASLLGATKGDIVGQNLTQLMCGRSSDDLRTHLHDVMSSEVTKACDVVVDVPTRPPFRAHLDSIAVRDEKGAFIEVRTVLSRRQLDHEAWLSEIVDRIDDGLYAREPDGEFSHVSRGCERLWGRSSLELVTTKGAWLASIDPSDRLRVLQAHERCLHGEVFDEEYRVRRADGVERMVRDRAFLYAEDGWDEPRIVGFAQDITDTRALETELWQAQKMEAMGTLASGLAHDFRNLLQAILGCATAAVHAETPDDSRAQWSHVLDAVRRGSDLVGHLMAFSRKEPVTPRATPIDAVIQAATKMLAPLVGGHIKLLIGAGAPTAAVMADPIQIEQILMNLAANARDAMPLGGTLTIWTESVAAPAGSPPRIRLLVSDTGRGIDDAVKGRLFEPFFTTKAAGAGTGLGLATVRAIVERMHGEIRVESERDKGTTFIITLPCAARPDHEPAPRKRAPRLEARVLLVEDEPLVRMTLRQFLEDLGLQVQEACDAASALEVSQAVDLLISDVSLPGMMGPQLALRLRERFPGLRSLFISGEPRDELTASGRLGAGARFLAKPFTMEELGAAITSVLHPS